MTMKKITSLALSGALALSLSAPAFAAETATMNYEGSVQAPAIAVTVPDSGTIVLNPYKMSFTPDGASDAVTDQVYSGTQYIYSESNVPLKVSASVTGTLPTSQDKANAVTFATAPISTAKTQPTTKNVFMYFELVATEDNTSEVEWATSFDSKSTNQILLSAKATEKKDIITLPVATVNGNTTTPAGYGAFRVTGDAVSAPANAWTEDDAVTAAVAFTFTATETVEEA